VAPCLRRQKAHGLRRRWHSQREEQRCHRTPPRCERHVRAAGVRAGFVVKKEKGEWKLVTRRCELQNFEDVV